jgi:hypothetical protein
VTFTETVTGVEYTPEVIELEAELEIINCALLAKTPLKEIAEAYVGPLLSEGILKVTPSHVHIMNLVIERDRVVYFFIALSQLRTGTKYAHGTRGFTVEPITVVSGNDTQDGYKITSNAEDAGSVVLTRKLAAEVWEVVAFFVRTPDPKTFVQREKNSESNEFSVDTDEEL